MNVDSEVVGGRCRGWVDSSTRGAVDGMEETFRRGGFIDDGMGMKWKSAAPRP